MTRPYVHHSPVREPDLKTGFPGGRNDNFALPDYIALLEPAQITGGITNICFTNNRKNFCNNSLCHDHAPIINVCHYVKDSRIA